MHFLPRLGEIALGFDGVRDDKSNPFSGARSGAPTAVEIETFPVAQERSFWEVR
jgi:hypothetical protein